MGVWSFLAFITLPFLGIGLAFLLFGMTLRWFADRYPKADKLREVLANFFYPKEGAPSKMIPILFISFMIWALLK